ncbi:MAG: thioesterase [Chitinophagaceae bacterium]|nr:thioesterase [Chitinophagaceae bacterium]
MNKINLFCLPYAGGSRSAYYQYAKMSPGHLNIVPLELPGRGARFNEPPLTDVYAMVDDVFKQISNQLDRPYAIYGHSMGAILGYLLARRIDAERLNPPLHLFFTGCGGPSMLKKEKKLSEMERAALMKELREMGGMPDEILNNDHHLEIFLPILLADLKATETFEYVQSEKLNIPVSVITGSEEGISAEKVEAWKKETVATVDIQKLPGNHFFIFEYGSAIIELIMNALFPVINKQN